MLRLQECNGQKVTSFTIRTKQPTKSIGELRQHNGGSLVMQIKEKEIKVQLLVLSSLKMVIQMM